MKTSKTVMGVHAPPPRPTLQGALLVAVVLSLPFVLLAVFELAFL